MENRIFYKSPAGFFEEALPLGNGAFGGMVYGNIQKEKLSLNLDTLWNGKPVTQPQEDRAEHFKEIMRLHREGKREEADRYLETNFVYRQSCAYLPMGNIYIENSGKYEGEYIRYLNFQKGLAVTEISGNNGVKYEYLFSNPSACAAIKISSKNPCDIKISFETLLTYLPESWNKTSFSGGGVYANLFDAHPPFQIDGNFGVASGIALMLVQKEDGVIKILPALPKELSKQGSIQGLRLKGGISIDLEWRCGKAVSIYLTSKRDTTEKLLVDGNEICVHLKLGEKTKIEF